MASASLLLPLEWLSGVHERGAAFRSRLNAEERETVWHAQAWFLLSQYATLLLYYAGTAEQPCKFPASMSYTASKGLPKLAFLFPWLRGWWLLLGLLWDNSDCGTLAFAGQMVGTGLFTLHFNRPGQSRLSNQFHLLGAVAYTTSHVPMLVFLGMTGVYQIAFFTAFLLAVMSFCSSRHAKRAAGLPPKYASSPSEWKAMLEAAGPMWHGQLWLSELAFMASENAIFTVFVCGIGSGMPLLAVTA